MKNNFRKAALSTICMLLVAVMSLTGATYAWFTAGTTATVNGMHMEVTAAEGGVQISAYKGTAWSNWASTVDLETLGDGTGVKPSSTIDGINFYTITPDEDDNMKATVTKVTNTDGTYYVSNRIRLKNPAVEDVIVSLNASTTIKDATLTTTGADAIATDIENAARIAFILTDESGTPLTSNGKTYIWAASENTAEGNTPASDNYFGLKKEGTDVTLDANGFVVDTMTEYGAEVTTTASGNCEFSLPGIEVSQGVTTETVVYIMIVVWVEGQDADCVNYNAGGMFDVQIQFEVDKNPVVAG